MTLSMRVAAIALPLVLAIQAISMQPAVADGKKHPLSSSLRTVSMSQALASIPAGRARTPKKTPEIAAAAASHTVTQRKGGNKTAIRAVTAADKAKIVTAVKAHQNGQKANRFAGIVPQTIVPQDVPEDGTEPPADQAPADPTYATSELYGPIEGEVADDYWCFWLASDDPSWATVFNHISACSKQAYEVTNCLTVSCSEFEIAYYASVLVGTAWKSNDGSATPTDVVWREYLWPLDPMVTVSAGTLHLGVTCGSPNNAAYTWSSCSTISGVQTVSASDINAADQYNPYVVSHTVRFDPDDRDGQTDQVLTHWQTQHFAYITGVGFTEAGLTYVRCDNSPYFSGGPACVFDVDVSEFNRLSTFNYEVDEMAWHVSSAMWMDENMPGRDTNPLTRDKTNASAARALSRARCQSNFPVEFADSAYQCDEYPFASVAQNAVSYADFSVEEISASDNQIGGRYLAGWYFSQRIIKGDAFTVWVETIG